MIGWLIIIQFSIIVGYVVYKSDGIEDGILATMGAALLSTIIMFLASVVFSVFVLSSEDYRVEIQDIDKNEALSLFSQENKIPFVEEGGKVNSRKFDNVFLIENLEQPYLTYAVTKPVGKWYDWLTITGSEGMRTTSDINLYLPEEEK